MSKFKKNMAAIVENMRYIRESLAESLMKQQALLAELQQKVMNLQDRVTELESALRGVAELKWMRKYFDIKMYGEDV